MLNGDAVAVAVREAEGETLRVAVKLRVGVGVSEGPVIVFHVMPPSFVTCPFVTSAPSQHVSCKSTVRFDTPLGRVREDVVKAGETYVSEKTLAWRTPFTQYAYPQAASNPTLNAKLPVVIPGTGTTVNSSSARAMKLELEPPGQTLLFARPVQLVMPLTSQ